MTTTTNAVVSEVKCDTITYQGMELKRNKTYQTNAYYLFKLLPENRYIKRTAVQNLVKSFQQTNGMSPAKPISIDSEFNVLDGQHRLEACKVTGYPVCFQIIDKDTEDIIVNFNKYQERWLLDDYTKYWAVKGNKNYQSIKNIADTTGVSVNYVLAALNYSSKESYKNGTFVFDGDVNESVNQILKLRELCSLTREQRQINKKICVAVRILQKVKSFSLDELIKKVAKNPQRVHGCDTTRQYVEMYAKVYNYNSRNGKLISDVDLAKAQEEV